MNLVIEGSFYSVKLGGRVATFALWGMLSTSISRLLPNTDSSLCQRFPAIIIANLVG